MLHVVASQPEGRVSESSHSRSISPVCRKLRSEKVAYIVVSLIKVMKDKRYENKGFAIWHP